MNCDICKARISATFLGKILGTYLRDNGRIRNICFECQRKFPQKPMMLEQIK